MDDKNRTFIENLWRWKCGMPEIKIIIEPPPRLNYNDLKKTEWCKNFEMLCRNRMIMGAFRYGKLFDKNKYKYDRIESIKRRINDYEKTGNTENLVDIANLCRCEFIEGAHPNRHFKSIDDGEHVRQKK